MSLSKSFIICAFFYLLGILFHNIYLNIEISLGLLALLAVVFFVYVFLKKSYIIVAISAIISLGLGIGISEYNIQKIENNINILIQYKGKNNLQLEIQSKKRVTEDSTVYIAKLLSINENTIPNISLELFSSSNYELHKGDIITTKSKLYFYKNSPEFKYQNYMLSQNIYVKVYPYNYEKIGTNPPYKIERFLIQTRKKLLTIINEIYPEEEAIFLGGILLGAREELPQELKTNFNNSGLTHFIAVSGFNITILILFFSVIVKWLPPIFRMGIIVTAIIIFTYLVGPTPPVIRAAIMGMAGFLIVSFGRKPNILAIILITAILMVSYSPLALNYDVSLQLSFLAVLGIVYTEKFWNKCFAFVPNILEIRTALAITFAALVFTLPIMIFNFGQVSVWAPITNVLVTWTIPIAMLVGFISILGFLISTKIGVIIGFFAWILLRWDIFVVNFFGSLNSAILEVDMGVYSGYYQVIIFLIIIFTVVYFQKSKKD